MDTSIDNVDYVLGEKREKCSDLSPQGLLKVLEKAVGRLATVANWVAWFGEAERMVEKPGKLVRSGAVCFTAPISKSTRLLRLFEVTGEEEGNCERIRHRQDHALFVNRKGEWVLLEEDAAVDLKASKPAWIVVRALFRKTNPALVRALLKKHPEALHSSLSIVCRAIDSSIRTRADIQEHLRSALMDVRPLLEKMEV